MLTGQGSRLGLSFFDGFENQRYLWRTMGCEPLALDPEIAVRLADEGVPLRAIARAVRVPSDKLREQLYEACCSGQLVDMPRDDWPAGFPRDQRALQLSRMVSENREALLVAMQRLFGLTPSEITLLLALIQHPTLLKERVHNTMEMAAKTVDVHMCSIRKRLGPFGVEIHTLWGQGYEVAPEGRRKVLDLIIKQVGST